jgi:hypothetical protein
MSVNCTVNGAVPLVVLAVKFATGSTVVTSAKANEVMHISAAIQRIRNSRFIFYFTYLWIFSPETPTIRALFKRTGEFLWGLYFS